MGKDEEKLSLSNVVTIISILVAVALFAAGLLGAAGIAKRQGW